MRNKKNRKQTNRVLIVLLQTMVELLSALKYGFIEELDKIAVIIQIFIPIIIVKMELSIPKMLIVSCATILATKYIKEVGYKLNNVTERGFPIPTKRFTEQDENGFIGIEEERTQEAIIYLCDVEDYLKSKGWLK